MNKKLYEKLVKYGMGNLFFPGDSILIMNKNFAIKNNCYVSCVPENMRLALFGYDIRYVDDIEGIKDFAFIKKSQCGFVEPKTVSITVPLSDWGLAKKIDQILSGVYLKNNYPIRGTTRKECYQALQQILNLRNNNWEITHE